MLEINEDRSRSTLDDYRYSPLTIAAGSQVCHGYWKSRILVRHEPLYLMAYVMIWLEDNPSREAALSNQSISGAVLLLSPMKVLSNLARYISNL